LVVAAIEERERKAAYIEEGAKKLGEL